MLKVDQLILNYLDAEKQLIQLIYAKSKDTKKLYAIIKKQEKLLFDLRTEYDRFGETGEIKIVEVENPEQKIEQWKSIMKDKIGWSKKDKEILEQGLEKNGTK